MGYVGVGVLVPQQLLHVGTGAVEITSGTVNSNTYDNRVASLIFSRPDIPTSWLNRITNSWSGNNYDSTMNFEVSNGPSTYATPLTLTGNGRVGIGLQHPDYTLDVNGTIHASQVIGATYQDVAEWVPATAKMSPGTVVVVQRGAKNTVMPSEAAYATSVAGVVSEKPGLILGESSDSKAMIATTGRVKVHVDASSGAIEAGDLLVTSGKARDGHEVSACRPRRSEDPSARNADRQSPRIPPPR